MTPAGFYFLWILGVFALVGCLCVAVSLVMRLDQALEHLDDTCWPFGPR